MAWTAPRTWTTSEVVTAAHMNAHVRDNFLETAAAKATTATGMFFATGANAIAERVPKYQLGDNSYAGAGTDDGVYATYQNSTWGSGTNVEVTATTGTTALVIHGFESVAGQINQTYSISGATSVAVGHPRRCVANIGNSGSRLYLETSLTAGSNSFRLAASATDVSASTVARPHLWVMPL